MEHFESLYPPNTRENEISKILAFIKEGSSCQVIGLPGGGRSNLLGLLSYNRNVRIKHLGENQKWFHFVLCNFAEVRHKPLTEAIKFLFLSLIDSMHARHSGNQAKPEHPESLYTLQGSVDVGDSGQARMTKRVVNFDDIKTLKEIFSESIVGNDDLVLFQGLKRAIDFLAIEKELTVVFLFDKFEDYVSTAQPEFFTNLRVLRDRAKYRFSVVFSLHKPLEDLIGEDILLDFYQFVVGHTVYLSLSDKIGLDFRISYIEKASGKMLDKKTIDSILKVTAGHPNLTRLAVESILESPTIILRESPAQQDESRSSRSRLRSNNKLEELLLEQKPVKSALFDIWKSLTPAEQKLLITYSSSEAKRSREVNNLTIKQSNNDGSRQDGYRTVTRQARTISSSYLENAQLIKDSKITIPLFTQFVKQFTKASSHIAFDPNTLSDSLTSSEFKLLKFLLQNSNRIIEREEVINSVWADAKSTAGVTDQALDQLIFRLRKKIEDDPNSPIYLQTVKGRGFRFTS